MNDQTTQTVPDNVQRVLPWIVAIAFFMQMLDTTILNTAIPSIAKDLNESPFHMQSTIVAYALTIAIIIPLSGYLADKVGTRRLFVFAVGLFSFGSLLCALSLTLNALVISRIIQAMGGAMMMPVARLTLIKAVKRSDFLSAMNFATIPGLIGPILGPLLGGYLVDVASWHWIFLINIPIGICGIYFGLKYMPNLKGNGKESFDLIGYSLFTLAIVLISLSLEFISKDNSLIFSTIIFISGFALLGCYFFYAHHYKDAIFPMSLFAIRTFKIGIISSLISRIGMSAIPLLIPLLLQVQFGYSATFSGWMLVPTALASICMKFVIMRIVSYWGYRKVLIANTCIVGLCIMSLSLLTHNIPIFILVIMLIIIGFANSVQFTAMNTITLADLYGSNTSSGNTLSAAVQQLSVSLGIAASASLLSIFNQQTLFNINTSQSFQLTFLILGFITLLSSLLFAKLKKSDGNNLIHKTV